MLMQPKNQQAKIKKNNKDSKLLLEFLDLTYFCGFFWTVGKGWVESLTEKPCSDYHMMEPAGVCSRSFDESGG